MAKKKKKKATQSLASSSKFKKVMREFANGTLRGSDGKVIRNLAQARAIAFSEARSVRG